MSRFIFQVTNKTIVNIHVNYIVQLRMYTFQLLGLIYSFIQSIHYEKQHNLNAEVIGAATPLSAGVIGARRPYSASNHSVGHASKWIPLERRPA